MSNDKERLESLLDWWKTSDEKKWRSFVNNPSLSFNDAFKIDEAAYTDTSAMISRLDTVYATKNWASKTGMINDVYWKMIEKADTKEKLEQIVKHVNENWDKKIDIGTAKPWNTNYKITKKDDKYVLEGWETTTDAQQ